jgi:hypothetical protein
VPESADDALVLLRPMVAPIHRRRQMPARRRRPARQAAVVRSPRNEAQRRRTLRDAVPGCASAPGAPRPRPNSRQHRFVRRPNRRGSGYPIPSVPSPVVPRVRARPAWERQRAGLDLLAWPRQTPFLVIVLGVAGCATRQPDGIADHRDYGMIRQPALARTVVIQNVTKPRLALRHQEPSLNSRWREGWRKATQS